MSACATNSPIEGVGVDLWKVRHNHRVFRREVQHSEICLTE